MILRINGDINRYYIQTLCMIFFPGASFPNDEQPGPGVPELDLTLQRTDNGYKAYTRVFLDGAEATAEKERTDDPNFSDERLRKLVVGESVISALGDLMEYRPSWGVMTGVRPSKVATEMLNAGISKTRTKKTLVTEYFVFPKKAALATDVAINERSVIDNTCFGDYSLYVSIPFCPSRCAYCSFVSYTSKRFLSLIPDYIERLIVDMSRVVTEAKNLGLRLRSVYFGGGTPTILDPSQMKKVLTVLFALLDGEMPEEFTFESGRPDTITLEKMKILKEFGIKRISVNPQTLCDDVLEGIGRRHTVEDFYRAYAAAREAGIEIINTDLIAGLPGDNFRKFSASVDGIIALRPENVTVHTFCVKRSAALNQEDGIYSMRGGDVGKCVDYSQIKFQEAGYIPYYMYRQKNTVGNFENVGFAFPGFEGKYNIYMMEELHTVLAVGAGAVSKFVSPAIDGEKPVIKRYFNSKYPYEYLDRMNCDGLIDELRAFYNDYPLNKNGVTE